MIAILQRAIDDAMAGQTKPARTERSAQIRAARQWIFSDDASHLFAYRFICEQLNINPRQLVACSKRRWKNRPR